MDSRTLGFSHFDSKKQGLTQTFSEMITLNFEISFFFEKNVREKKTFKKKSKPKVSSSISSHTEPAP